jgi:Tol biopolymer transport system component
MTIRPLARIGLVALLSAAVVSAQSLSVELQRIAQQETVSGNLKHAIEEYKKLVARAGSDRAIAAQALVRMAECYQKLGDAEARRVYEQLVRDFGDQKESATARARLAALASPAIPSTAPASRQVWAGRGVDGMGRASLDGRYLTFTDWETGDLAVRNFESGTTHRLTNTGGWVASGDYAIESLISTDGRRVLYHWFVEKESMFELRVIPLADSGPVAQPRVLFRSTEYVGPHGWSPDGRSVYVIRWGKDNTQQIGVIRDGVYRSLKSLEWRSPNRLSLSPDGRFLAYDIQSGDNGSPRDIMAIAVDGSSEFALVQTPANDDTPLWTPGGTHVMFTSDRTGGVGLWSIAVENGQPKGSPELVKNPTGEISLLGMTRTGRLFYLLPGRARRNVYSVDVNGDQASTPTMATDSFVNANFGASWSPDGTSLAYLSARDTPSAPPRLVVKTGGQPERAIQLPSTVASLFNAGPRWFPDGKSMLIMVRKPQSGGFEFQRVDLETGKTSTVWSAQESRSATSSFTLSPDGRSIFYAIQNDGTGAMASGKLVRVDLETRSQQVLKQGEWFITVAISPDGQQLAYLKSIRENTSEYPAAIEVMPAAGGPSRQVFRDPRWLGGSRYNALAWTPDQRSLVFVREAGREVNVVWRIPLSGGEPSRVGVSMSARLKSLSFHPSGRQLTFTAIESDKTRSGRWRTSSRRRPLETVRRGRGESPFLDQNNTIVWQNRDRH